MQRTIYQDAVGIPGAENWSAFEDDLQDPDPVRIKTHRKPGPPPGMTDRAKFFWPHERWKISSHYWVEHEGEGTVSNVYAVRAAGAYLVWVDGMRWERVDTLAEMAALVMMVAQS